MTISRDDILKLTVSERLDLIDTIWGSIADDADLPLTDAQRREIDRRLVQYARSTPLLKSWDETRARLERPGNVAVSPARTDVDDLALIEKHIGSPQTVRRVDLGIGHVSQSVQRRH
jgi:putative addiction module component (TIGR02574 family)